MADETISVWQDKTDGVEMGPSQQCVPQSHTDAARTPGISNMGRGHSKTTWTKFCPISTTYPPSIVDILNIISLRDQAWTFYWPPTYLPTFSLPT